VSPKAETSLTLLLLAACLGLLGWQLWPRLNVQRVEMTVEQPDITVSVAGAVVAPGVYALPWGSRAEDAVAKAGGLTDAAEATLLNLADPLTTGETVFVPEARTATGEDRLSLNTATERELELLVPGVGPVTAAKIVSARPFESVEDLLNVSGIGPATLEKIRPYVRP